MNTFRFTDEEDKRGRFHRGLSNIAEIMGSVSITGWGKYAYEFTDFIVELSGRNSRRILIVRRFDQFEYPEYPLPRKG